jgi:DNA-binding transcriptional LysR family regulator
VRLSPLPGRPHRKLTTGVRAGATRDPAVRAFRDALRRAVREGGTTGPGATT